MLARSQLRVDRAFQDEGPGKAGAYIDEAAAILEAGKTVALDADRYPDGYEPLAQVLQAMKAQVLNGLYESQSTNGAIAGFIAESVISTGDYRSYLLYVDKIKAVTAEQIAGALDKYLFKGTISWVALGPNETLASARASDFESWRANSEP